MKKEGKKVVRKVRQQTKQESDVKQTKSTTRSERQLEEDNVMTIIVSMVIVVVLSILVLRLNERLAYNQLRRANERRDGASIKDLVPKPYYYDDYEDEDQENLTYDEVDLNKYEIIKGIIRLFPKKNDAKLKGDNVYKAFNLKDFERHETKLTSYYGNYKIVYHYISGSGDTSEITIYNKKTKKVVYTNSYIKTALVDDSDLYHNILPTVSGGKLHILAYNTDRCYVDGYGDLSPYLEYIQIPLKGNKLTETEVLSLKGFDFGEVPACR